MDILFLLVVYVVPVLVAYVVIRLAVRHGVMDAHRRLPGGGPSGPGPEQPPA